MLYFPDLMRDESQREARDKLMVQRPKAVLSRSSKEREDEKGRKPKEV